jgi:hypothetical protein
VRVRKRRLCSVEFGARIGKLAGDGQLLVEIESPRRSVDESRVRACVRACGAATERREATSSFGSFGSFRSLGWGANRTSFAQSIFFVFWCRI